jgi:hypothetical protein
MANDTAETGRGSVRTHPLPPDGFDPRAASPLELRRYGLPQRPDPAVRPELAARWDDVFSRKLSYITPVFQPVEELAPGISRADRPRPEANGTNGTWSGTVAHAPNGEAFEWVFSQWNVPYVEPGGEGPGSWWAATWIGIDGVSDVTQIGTMQVVSADAAGNITTSCFAWREWWSASTPSPWVAIPNFPVSFGDTVCGLVCLLSPTEANFSMINMTTGVHVGFGSIPLDAPPGTSSLENQAEWILERPELSSGQAQLPDFSEIRFDEAYAGGGPAFFVNGGAADTVLNMVEDGVTVATTTIGSPTFIKIDYTGGPPPVEAGQLLSYGDDGTPGNVSDPVAVGFGGWLPFKFLFAGPNAAGQHRIYAVDPSGQLLAYSDDGTSGDVANPVTVGFGGWLPFQFLFAGANAAGQHRIYAVDPSGQLLSYADDGTPGNVSDPDTVGFGGWLQFKFLFAGPNAAGQNRIYAVDQSGQLLSYADDGTPGNVSDPDTVGFGGWLPFKFLFAGPNAAGQNRIYAVDQSGQLLSYGDDGTPGNVSDPVTVGFGGWLQFKFLFAGANTLSQNRIYAVPA